jgi:hypothetical protein
MAQGPGEVEEGSVRTGDTSTAATAAAPTTDDIRSQIEQTRAEMSDTIDAIQTRLSPARAIADAKDSVTEATVGRLKRLAHRMPGSGRSLLETISRHHPMNSASDPLGRLKPIDSSLAPLAVLGAVTVTAGLTAYLAWPARRWSASTQKRQALIAYLRDHLSGSDMAIRVVHRLSSTHQATEDGALFRRLSEEFEEDRSVVRLLLTRLGASGRSMKRAAGYASGALLSVTAGGAPGDLSLLRTLEALAVGVQGKRCLWRALQNLRTLSTIQGMNFVELEAKAVRQWEAIEERRRALVTRTFSATDPRAE